MKLFEDDWGKDESPVDNTEITTTIFYFDKATDKERKRKAKELMKHYWADDYKDKGNLSDLFDKLLNEKHEEISSKEGNG